MIKGSNDRLFYIGMNCFMRSSIKKRDGTVDKNYYISRCDTAHDIFHTSSTRIWPGTLSNDFFNGAFGRLTLTFRTLDNLKESLSLLNLRFNTPLNY